MWVPDPGMLDQLRYKTGIQFDCSGVPVSYSMGSILGYHPLTHSWPVMSVGLQYLLGNEQNTEVRLLIARTCAVQRVKEDFQIERNLTYQPVGLVPASDCPQPT